MPRKLYSLENRRTISSYFNASILCSNLKGKVFREITGCKDDERRAETGFELISECHSYGWQVRRLHYTIDIPVTKLKNMNL